MGNLALAIKRVIESNEMTAAEFAARSGLLKSNLSHIISGRREYVGPKLLGRMVASVEPKQAKSLVEAYLLDEFDRVIAEAQKQGPASPSFQLCISWS